MVRLIIISYLLVIGSSLLAETPANSVPALKTFDNDFFAGPKPEAEAAKKKETEGGRAVAENPDYNYAQRDRWLETCSIEKDKDSKAFKDCYQKEKTRELGTVKQRQTEKENDMAQPFKSVNPLMPEALRGGGSPPSSEND